MSNPVHTPAPVKGTAMPNEVNKPAVGSPVSPTPDSRPAPAAPEHPASPGAVGPPQPPSPGQPAVTHNTDTQARTPGQEADKAGPGQTGTIPDPAKDPSGLAPDRDIKQRTLDANKEAHDAKAVYDRLKDKCTMLYPMPGQNQQVHNPVTAHGDCQIPMSETPPVIEVRLNGHNKSARAEVQQGKWAAHFDVLPTGTFEFEMYVNGILHCSAKADVVM